MSRWSHREYLVAVLADTGEVQYIPMVSRRAFNSTTTIGNDRFIVFFMSTFFLVRRSFDQDSLDSSFIEYLNPDILGIFRLIENSMINLQRVVTCNKVALDAFKATCRLFLPCIFLQRNWFLVYALDFSRPSTRRDQTKGKKNLVRWLEMQEREVKRRKRDR